MISRWQFAWPASLLEIVFLSQVCLLVRCFGAAGPSSIEAADSSELERGFMRHLIRREMPRPHTEKAPRNETAKPRSRHNADATGERQRRQEGPALQPHSAPDEPASPPTQQPKAAAPKLPAPTMKQKIVPPPTMKQHIVPPSAQSKSQVLSPPRPSGHSAGASLLSEVPPPAETLQQTELLDSRMLSAANVAERAAKAVKAVGGSSEEAAMAFGMTFENTWSSHGDTRKPALEASPPPPKAALNTPQKIVHLQTILTPHTARVLRSGRHNANALAQVYKPNLIVQGHTALKNKRNCKNVALQACSAILAAEQARQAAAPQSAQETYTMPADKQEAYQDFCQGKTPTFGDITAFLAELSAATTAMMDYGVPWSVHDQEKFARCFEHTTTVPEAVRGVWAGGRYRNTSQGDCLSAVDTTTGLSLLDVDALVAKGHRWGGNLWQHSSSIHYCFSSTISDAARQGTLDAIGSIEAQVPCVDFHQTGLDPFSVDENCKEMPSIIIQSKAEGCWSYVGQVSGMYEEYTGKSQEINIGSGCEIMGIVAHEFGHALGMLHEMSRSDRDTYLRVHFDNVKVGFEEQFAQNDGAFTDSTFDYLSLMMYSAYAFTKKPDEQVVLEPADERVVPYLGQRLGFSEIDVSQLGEMYNCKDQVTPSSGPSACFSQRLLQGGGAFDFQGECADVSSTEYKAENGDELVELTCQHLAKLSYCTSEEYGADVRSKCPIACCLCFPVAAAVQMQLTGANGGTFSAGNSAVHGFLIAKAFWLLLGAVIVASA